MAEPAPRLVDLLSAAQRLVAKEVGEELEGAAGIPLDHWRALRLLDPRTGLNMRDLAERLLLPPATVTRVVDSLVDRGLAYRHPSSRDRRQIDVFLSAAGEELIEPLEQVAERGEARAIAAAGFRDVEELVGALRALTSAQAMR